MDLSTAVQISRESRVALWQQVEVRFKQLIREGSLKPGQRLPPHQELCELVGVGHSTLQRALQSLTRQGYVLRRRRQGSFIAEPESSRREVMVAVMTRTPFDPASSPFDHLVARNLVDVLADAHQTFRFYHNHFVGRGHTLQAQEMDPQLLKDVQAGRIAGLLAAGAFPPDAEDLWRDLQRQKIPVVEMSSPTGTVSYSVNLDYNSLIDETLSCVKESDCRSVALISHELPFFDVRTRFASGAQAVGLKTHDDWILTIDAIPNQPLGQDLFQELWRKRQKPDAVIVLDDVLAQGVAMGVFKTGLSVPNDLVLVAHATLGADLAYPVLVREVAFDPRELIQASWQMLSARMKGLPVKNRKVLIPARISNQANDEPHLRRKQAEITCG